MAVAAREGDVESRRARRARAAAPASRCAASRPPRDGCSASHVRNRFGPAASRRRSPAPGSTAIGTPLRVAPSPAAARNSSSVTGRIDRRQHRPAVDRQRRRDHPVRRGRRDRRACRRSDRRSRPRSACEPRGIVLGFLRQPAVGPDRARRAARAAASTARSASHTGDDWPLSPLLQRAAEGLQRERAALAHGRDQELAFRVARSPCRQR